MDRIGGVGECLAFITDYENQFDPYQWTTYEYSPTSSTTPPQNTAPQSTNLLPFYLFAIGAASIAVTVIAMLFIIRRRRPLVTS